MAKKCPECGAPMEGNRCTYCNYEEVVAKPQSTPKSNTHYSRPGEYKTQVEHFVVHLDAKDLRGSSKNKMVALILCILFGYFGAHQFYAGKSGMGILYFFTLGLFGIGWIVDIFLICKGSFKDAKGYPINK